MEFPFTLDNFGLLIALFSVMLIITSEFVSNYYGYIGILIDKKRLKNLIFLFAILFLLMTIQKTFYIISTFILIIIPCYQRGLIIYN